MKFIGVDFGWTSQPSGLCCLELKDGKLQLIDIDRQDHIADIFLWIDEIVKPEEPAIIAVDAPTLIPNPTGSRLPDKLSHKYFGKYHAGCYPANQNLAFAERTINFGLELEKRGFMHAPKIEPQKPGRYQIEVFPHPAIVNLFQLEKILKYKKGKIAERRLELIKLHNKIQEILPNISPCLCSSAFTCDVFTTEISNTGKELKAMEDKLDSLICAYVGAYWWFWGTEKNLVLGDENTGYIVVPERIGK
ncbi:MAG: DUF429 domain-containing protein [Nostocales cyanobacterium]|nr:MAG: DUF429 domain-containing protein [Nostocales cyanobacterium]TAF18141.1 MAG: DUF429 domain-containing protein [Nostocales cyanobacterium]